MVLRKIRIENKENSKEYPFFTDLYRKGFELEFAPITIIAGENGVGKSTLLESIACKVGFSAYGGNGNHKIMFSKVNKVLDHYSRISFRTVEEEMMNDYSITTLDNTELTDYMSIEWSYKTSQGFFIRSETFANLINLKLFRDASTKSHGEGILEILYGIKEKGLFILDEPEAGLSPFKTIEMMQVILQKSKQFDAQFIISTHSPIFMCMPNCKLLEMTDRSLNQVDFKDMLHFNMTKKILNDPEGFVNKYFCDINK